MLEYLSPESYAGKDNLVEFQSRLISVQEMEFVNAMFIPKVIVSEAWKFKADEIMEATRLQGLLLEYTPVESYQNFHDIYICAIMDI